MAETIEAIKEKDSLPPIVAISRADRQIADTSGGVDQS
jgi:hypothetical protein